MKYLTWLAVVLTAIMFGAKLAGTISCSWWTIFSPLFVAFGLWLAVTLIILAIIGIYILIVILSDK